MQIHGGSKELKHCGKILKTMKIKTTYALKNSVCPTQPWENYMGASFSIKKNKTKTKPLDLPVVHKVFFLGKKS